MEGWIERLDKKRLKEKRKSRSSERKRRNGRKDAEWKGKRKEK